jgi:ABC-type spermidine/putrescine transport system permease subunit II
MLSLPVVYNVNSATVGLATIIVSLSLKVLLTFHMVFDLKPGANAIDTEFYYQPMLLPKYVHVPFTT